MKKKSNRKKLKEGRKSVLEVFLKLAGSCES
jgi:hypothetical protein